MYVLQVMEQNAGLPVSWLFCGSECVVFGVTMLKLNLSYTLFIH